MDNPPNDQPPPIKRPLRIKIMLPGGETAVGKALLAAIKTKDQKTRDAIDTMTLGKKQNSADISFIRGNSLFWLLYLIFYS